MIFNTWLFALFGVAVLAIYWMIERRWRSVFLMLAGIVFYAASIPAYALLILALGAVTYADAKLLLRTPPEHVTRRKWILAAGIAASAGVLALFKYTKFVIASINDICGGRCIHSAPDIIVPLAVSFFTFEFVHVLVDVYLGEISIIRFREFAMFTLFFPTMVAGPIKRYQNFVPQIDRVETVPQLVFATGIYRIVLGLAKKLIAADSMTPFLQPLLNPSASYTQVDYWIGMLAYTAKIYFDFTGYSDIAIGIASLLGYQILENFDRPYWAPDISQFWRRWHMSLSSWIRDYLFIPMGGSRQGRLKTSFNLAVVMGLAGLWHGAAWHFVVWGVWHGIGLAAHRVWSRTLGRKCFEAFGEFQPLLKGTSIAVTFLFVAFGWVLFACPSVGAAVNVYAGLLAPRSSSGHVFFAGTRNGMSAKPQGRSNGTTVSLSPSRT